MTAPDPSESQRLTALVQLLRKAVPQPSEAELGRGLGRLRARSTRRTRSVQQRGRLVLSTTLVVALLVSSLLFLGLSYLRSRESLPAAPVAVDKIEGGELLRRVESMTMEEIASTMEISVSTAKRSMARASSRLSRWVDSDPVLAALVEETR